MNHFVVEITYSVPFEQLSATVPAHRAFLQTGYDRGWLLCSGPLPSRTGGIVVARAPSLEELEAFFTDDPYQRQNLATYRFIAFEPVKFQPFLAEWVGV